MLKHLNQKGSSLLVILGLIVVVAGMGTGGWLVWGNNQDTAKNPSASTQQNKQDKNKPKSPKDPSEDGKYLVIKEWGVRLPLAAEIADAYYEFDADGAIEFLSIYDAGFDKLKNADGVTCGGNNVYQIYSISRIKTENLSTLQENEQAAYRKFPFTGSFMFRGLGAHQAPPSCAHVNMVNGEAMFDERILTSAEVKEQAFTKAFDYLQDLEN